MTTAYRYTGGVVDGSGRLEVSDGTRVVPVNRHLAAWVRSRAPRVVRDVHHTKTSRRLAELGVPDACGSTLRSGLPARS